MSAQRRPSAKRDRAQEPAAPPAAPSAAANGAAAAATAASRPASPRPPKPAAAASSRPPMPKIEPERQPAPGARGRLGQRFDGLRNTYRDTTAELKKVNWPDRETTRNLTIVVIAVSIALGILLGAVDFLLQSLFAAIP